MKCVPVHGGEECVPLYMHACIKKARASLRTMTSKRADVFIITAYSIIPVSFLSSGTDFGR